VKLQLCGDDIEKKNYNYINKTIDKEILSLKKTRCNFTLKKQSNNDAQNFIDAQNVLQQRKYYRMKILIA
jgi:hypothetical protein